MFLMINANNVIVSIVDEHINRQAVEEEGNYLVEVPDEKILGDLLGSIFHGFDNDEIRYTQPPAMAGFQAIDGEWVDARSEHEKWEQIRLEREAMLQQSDWTQIPDSPLDEEQKAAWRNWRQDVRDIPQTYTDVQSAGDALYKLEQKKPTSL